EDASRRYKLEQSAIARLAGLHYLVDCGPIRRSLFGAVEQVDAQPEIEVVFGIETTRAGPARPVAIVAMPAVGMEIAECAALGLRAGNAEGLLWRIREQTLCFERRQIDTVATRSPLGQLKRRKAKHERSSSAVASHAFTGSRYIELGAASIHGTFWGRVSIALLIVPQVRKGQPVSLTWTELVEQTRLDQLFAMTKLLP